MDRRSFLGGAMAAPLVAAPEGSGVMTLPKPVRRGGKPLMEALDLRRTNRALRPAKLSPQQLSNMLWAAFGVNRADGRRTAPTAMNVQDTQIYVFLEEGVYFYDAAAHVLKKVLEGDHRASAGTQEDMRQSPVALVYVSDHERFTGGARPVTDTARITAWENVHAGFIGQNVYLYAASEGMGLCFRASIDGPGVAKLLNLKPTQKVLYSQTVGLAG
jgi:nitroreductase